MPVTAILAGAAITDYDWLASELSHCDTIICADSGLRHAHAMGRVPDSIIGDFDSVDPELLNYYKDKSKIIHLPDQNMTDLMKALSIVNATHEVIVYSAVGERADHDFSNYLILLNHNKNQSVILKTPCDERRIVKSSVVFTANIGDMVGVFPLLPINTLSYKGLKYNPEDLSGSYIFGWNGACNPVVSERVEINLDSGAALITRSYRNRKS